MSDQSDARLARWRRDLHRYPELGFLEYRTAALLCSELERLPGVQLRVGRHVMDPAACLDVPAAEMHVQARADALSRGACPQ